MIDQAKMLKSCAYIVGSVVSLFALLYLLEGEWVLTLILLVLGASLVLPCLLLATPSNLRFFICYLVVHVNIEIFLIQLLSRNFTPSAPLYICAGALSALFFSRALVRLGFLCGAALFVLQCALLSLLSGAPVAEIMILAECLLAILVSFLLVDLSVKNGNHYLAESTAKQEEAARLLAELDRKSAHTEAVLGRQQRLLAEISQVAHKVSGESQSLAGQSDGLAAGATEQAASIEHVSAAVEEISRQVQDTASQARQVRDASETMRRHAGEGGAQMEVLLSAVRDIEVSVGSIEQTIKAIQDIAFQTNILSLNAAVEAARAGTAGRGFAVVADEVRSLADNSAAAAREIIGVLSQCREAVSRGSRVAGETSTAMGRIKESVEDVARQAVGISDRTRAQLDTVGEIREEINQVSGVIQSTAAASQECSAMVRELSDQARQLNALSEMEGEPHVPA